MKLLNEWEIKRLKIYFKIFKVLISNPREDYKIIGEKLGGKGRGKSKSNYYQHHKNMKEQKISRNPILILNPFNNCKTNIYFCQVSGKKSKQSIYDTILQSGIEFAAFLIGNHDFFITSRKEINFENLNISHSSKLCGSIFTIPKTWKKDLEESISKLIEIDFKKGNFEREFEKELNWDKKRWEIYTNIQPNVRKSFSKIGRAVGLDHKTVKKYFYNDILPCCSVAHYFFPFGYDYYRQTLLRIKTDYEKSFVNSLNTIPCTTYVYILEKEICITFFHDNSNNLLKTIQKLEEMGIISGYTAYIPIDASEKF
ncbi:MAG: hypothetical protein PVF58_08040 [Candidatus Methanofastidiosia archaeon]